MLWQWWVGAMWLGEFLPFRKGFSLSAPEKVGEVACQMSHRSPHVNPHWPSIIFIILSASFHWTLCARHCAISFSMHRLISAF